MNDNKTAALPGTYVRRSTYADDYPTVQRCMAFVDMSSFTSYVYQNGSRAAAGKVADFRSIIRTTTGMHGIRVALWLGDGALLVGLSAHDVMDALCEIAQQCHQETIPVHCGVAMGDVIIFEGNDYLGQTLNIASRLSHIAETAEAYCFNIDHTDLPLQCTYELLSDISIRGAGNLSTVARVKLIPYAQSPA